MLVVTDDPDEQNSYQYYQAEIDEHSSLFLVYFEQDPSPVYRFDGVDYYLSDLDSVFAWNDLFSKLNIAVDQIVACQCTREIGRESYEVYVIQGSGVPGLDGEVVYFPEEINDDFGSSFTKKNLFVRNPLFTPDQDSGDSGTEWLAKTEWLAQKNFAPGSVLDLTLVLVIKTMAESRYLTTAMIKELHAQAQRKVLKDELNDLLTPIQDNSQRVDALVALVQSWTEKKDDDPNRFNLRVIQALVTRYKKGTPTQIELRAQLMIADDTRDYVMTLNQSSVTWNRVEPGEVSSSDSSQPTGSHGSFLLLGRRRNGNGSGSHETTSASQATEKLTLITPIEELLLWQMVESGGRSLVSGMTQLLDRHRQGKLFPPDQFLVLAGQDSEGVRRLVSNDQASVARELALNATGDEITLYSEVMGTIGTEGKLYSLKRLATTEGENLTQSYILVWYETDPERKIEFRIKDGQVTVDINSGGENFSSTTTITLSQSPSHITQAFETMSKIDARVLPSEFKDLNPQTVYVELQTLREAISNAMAQQAKNWASRSQELATPKQETPK